GRGAVGEASLQRVGKKTRCKSARRRSVHGPQLTKPPLMERCIPQAGASSPLMLVRKSRLWRQRAFAVTLLTTSQYTSKVAKGESRTVVSEAYSMEDHLALSSCSWSSKYLERPCH